MILIYKREIKQNAQTTEVPIKCNLTKYWAQWQILAGKKHIQAQNKFNIQRYCKTGKYHT